MDIKPQKARWLNLPVIVAFFMLCLMGAMFLHAWSQNNSFAPAIQVLLGTAEGGASGIVLTEGDITIYIPPDATDLPGAFSIAEANPDVALISNDTEWIRPKVVNVEFIQPNGLPLADITFSEPVEICFRLGDEQWQAFLSQPDAFEVQHYLDDADPPHWEVLPQSSSPGQQQLCGASLQLSAFALAIKVEAEVPVTGPTATGSISTLIPTRTLIPPIGTRERRDGAASESSLGGPAAPTSTNAPPPSQIQPTNTLRPPNTATLGPTNTSTPRPPTRTPRPPTNTPTDIPATNTPRPPTSTPMEPTNTPRPPTATDEPPTPIPPSNTPVPDDTDTPEPPPPPDTDTPEPPPPPPADTDTPEPTPG